MDIGSGKGYPSASLSNFHARRFIFDGVECYSIEGVLQSFKFKNVEMQDYVCSLIGMAAKRKGSKKNWKESQILYWRDREYKRNSKDYQDLLDRLYMCVYEQDPSFRKDLEATGKATMTHSIGKIKESDTVLTIREFCGRLTRLRDNNGIL